jgi:hypothetical protein
MMCFIIQLNGGEKGNAGVGVRTGLRDDGRRLWNGRYERPVKHEGTGVKEEGRGRG